jgi:hypothetical protein
MAVHVGDVGVLIELAVQEDGQDLDLATATNPEIRLRDPNGATTTHAAVVVAPNRVRYATDDGDLARPGAWQVRAHFTLGAWTGHTSALSMTVTPT